ncbi:MAG TPA: penicillin-binding transpeptidase domain-containing protein [Vicinamibacterales bacterium]|nr:penicillin-binding transpeptidase domain-containing protein [Vicinamibacterales bacterium]
MNDWRKTLKRRAIVVSVFLGLWAAGIEARLVYLQVVRHADLAARAEKQQMRTIDAPAMRGDIVDRHGRILATSVDADTVYAVPSEIADAPAVVAKLCEAFGDCTGKERQSLVERLSQRRPFAYVRRQISPEQAQRVAALNLESIGFIKESKRFYPNLQLAAHLIGYVGIDNNGLSGLEYTYDPQIRGKKGTILIQTDAKRHAFSRFERPPTTGATVELTIDEYLQHVAERELHDAVLSERALGGSVVMMNPRTGEILAMANEPTFNPNSYRDADEIERRNRAVQDLYEPGSTFKVVTASAAMEDKLFAPDALIDTHPGAVKLPGRPAITEDAHHDYGVLSFTDVLVKSSNVGAIKIGFKVGAERLSRFVGLYGFGKSVSPDFPAENAGIVWRPEKMTESALASVSMGYQVAITPLQMVAAVSAVANGGEYIEPRVLRAVYRGNRRFAVQPKTVRRAVSVDTAAALTAIMEQVVERGTAKRAKMTDEGFTIAGKTGTAQKLENGHYSHSDHFGSFVGFVPSRNPAIAMIVVIDSAKAVSDHGGVAAAPVFKDIAEAALRHLGVTPTLNPAPPVLLAQNHDSNSTLDPASAPNAADPIVSLVADGPPGTVPDVRGMSAREAVRKLVKLGLSARASGDGFVVTQSPEPGEPLEPGGVCRLTLARTPRRTEAAGHP